MQTIGPSTSGKGALLHGEDARHGGGGKHSDAHTLLSMYASPPREEISLDEFERLALERLRGGWADSMGSVNACVRACTGAWVHAWAA